MEETLDLISPILPVDFFSIAVDLHEADDKQSLKRSHVLPIFSQLLFEESFAKISMGWNQNGLAFEIDVEKAFEECFFPQYRKGDSLELFIDTRDLKSAGFLTRFCHHFVILPKPIEALRAAEVTHFRSDDRHELCDGDKILVSDDFRRRSYFLKIFIPSECLHGYDPLSFDRLGFTYKINRFGGNPQHFVVSSNYLTLENQPSLWSCMQMRRK